MRDAVVCSPLRTAVGAFGGMFASVPVQELASTVIRAVLDRTGLDPERVDDVVLGQGYPNGEAPALGRVAALDAGLPVSVPGAQLDRRCGSGLQAVLDAAMRVQTGVADVVLAGGAESMSQAEHYVLGARWGLKGPGELMDRLGRGRVTAGGRHHPVPGGMLVLGGHGDDDDEPNVPDELFDEVSGQWFELPRRMAQPRSSASAVLLPAKALTPLTGEGAGFLA